MGAEGRPGRRAAAGVAARSASGAAARSASGVTTCASSALARLRAVTPERVRTWFYSDAPAAAVAWFAAVVALVAVLGWFFVLSPYGAPASPVYAEF